MESDNERTNVFDAVTESVSGIESENNSVPPAFTSIARSTQFLLFVLVQLKTFVVALDIATELEAPLGLALTWTSHCCVGPATIVSALLVVEATSKSQLLPDCDVIDNEVVVPVPVALLIAPIVGFAPSNAYAPNMTFAVLVIVTTMSPVRLEGLAILQNSLSTLVKVFVEILVRVLPANETLDAVCTVAEIDDIPTTSNLFVLELV